MTGAVDMSTFFESSRALDSREDIAADFKQRFNGLARSSLPFARQIRLLG